MDCDDAENAIAVCGLMLSGMKFTTKNPKIKQGIGRMQQRLELLEQALEVADRFDSEGNESDEDDGSKGAEGNPQDGIGTSLAKQVAHGIGVGAGGAVLGGAGTAAVAAGSEATLVAAAGGGVAATAATGTGIGAAVLAPLAAIPVALTTPLWLGAFRVRSDVVFQVGSGVRLVDGKCHVTSGSFGSAFALLASCIQEEDSSALSTVLEEQRKANESTLVADFPTTLEEGATCLQFYNAWGSARGCCGFVSYRIDGSSHFVVMVVNNPFDRNLYNLGCGVCVSSCAPASNDAEAHALFALCDKGLSDHGFAGVAFSTDVDGAVVAASASGLRAEARMTSGRASAAWMRVSRSRRMGGATPSDMAKHCPRVRVALDNGRLAAALLLSLEASASSNGKTPRGRLTYINGGGGCARRMTVAYLDEAGQVHDEECQGNTLLLPEGARDILIKFYVIWGSTVKQIDRRHSQQPWVRASDGAYPEEVLTIENGDGTDAFFELHGTSLHSYVHRAWDFGRDPRGMPRDWEWWGADETEVAGAALALLPDEAAIRIRLDALSAVLPGTRGQENSTA